MWGFEGCLLSINVMFFLSMARYNILLQEQTKLFHLLIKWCIFRIVFQCGGVTINGIVNMDKVFWYGPRPILIWKPLCVTKSKSYLPTMSFVHTHTHTISARWSRALRKLGISCYKKLTLRSWREMAQCLRALIVLPKGLSLVPCTHVSCLQLVLAPGAIALTSTLPTKTHICMHIVKCTQIKKKYYFWLVINNNDVIIWYKLPAEL